jgi:hypothetical protein
LYTMAPGSEKKLTLHWADYEATNCSGFRKASNTVITKFVVRHTY